MASNVTGSSVAEVCKKQETVISGTRAKEEGLVKEEDCTKVKEEMSEGKVSEPNNKITQMAQGLGSCIMQINLDRV